jgi:hypothetical protein
VFLGKSGGKLYNPLLLQLTLTPTEWFEQLQTLGHDDVTPTSKITANITVIRNCMLRRQSTNAKCIYLIMCNIVMYV